jgi:hypothetical protein
LRIFYTATIRTDDLLNIDSLCTAAHLALSPVSFRCRLELRSAEMQPDFGRSSHIRDIFPRGDRTTIPREPSVIETIEQIAERIAGAMIAVASLFWLALLLAFVAETLGIIPNG